MAFKVGGLKGGPTPDKDTGWGLIFRLNNLFSRIDTPAENGDYDTWNTILDRIYCNLLYRNDLHIERDPKTNKIVSIEIQEGPEEIYRFLTSQIFKTKIDYLKAVKSPHKDPRLISQTRSKWYHAVKLKDIWLRKFMRELGIYLKETSHDPGSALFGSR